MNIPPKGTLARDSLILGVRWRQFTRQIYRALPGTVPWHVVVPEAGRILYRWAVFWGTVYMILVGGLLIWAKVTGLW